MRGDFAASDLVWFNAARRQPPGQDSGRIAAYRVATTRLVGHAAMRTGSDWIPRLADA